MSVFSLFLGIFSHLVLSPHHNETNSQNFTDGTYENSRCSQL